ncbi:hypothetical protein [Xanthomonas translucens]|uniref:hypothetical protein n=1 Tax=Xanthomonas campestris pv. translucens TaxID=343 RepID=UPI00071E7BD2|nr:hypothetical protein [Xanthomonas translucens]KTF40681.1 hypothetical protein OZ12_05505 [Xanthomonas translucens pv. translucens]
MNACNWFTAQEPRYVSVAAAPPERVAPSVKHQEARALAQAVEAHRCAGGAYIVLASNPVPPALRRPSGE